MYLDGHRLIARITGVENASELMEPVARPKNDPDEVLMLVPFDPAVAGVLARSLRRLASVAPVSVDVIGAFDALERYDR